MHEHIGSVTSGASHPEAYTAPSPQAVETEVADFLYGIIRLTHPDAVLETGTYLADTTVRLAQAVRDNGHGMVVSVEIDNERVVAARQRLITAKLAKHVRLLTGSFAKVNLRPPAGQYGVALFDSHWERDLEYHAARSHLAPGALLVFHDCGDQHKDGEVRARVAELERAGFIKGLYVPTPRGVVIAQHAPPAL